MRLENIVWDALDPQRLGRFWAAALDAEVITDEDEGIEARLSLSDDFYLDLCFPRVTDKAEVAQRLHLDLTGGAEQAAVVDRLVGLGAAPADVGQGDVPWVVLADPEGNHFCVMEERSYYPTAAGPVAALPLDSADPEIDARFWAALSGWTPVAGGAPYTLQHPTGRGPLLELCPELEPRAGKSALHLDIRVDGDDHDPLGLVRDLGGRVLEQPGTDLPWTVCADPSGNEVCLLGLTPPAS